MPAIARTTLMLVSAFALSAVAAPAFALATQPADDGDKLICKRTVKTGTRFAKKTCYTRAERDRQEEQQKRDAQELINRPHIEIRKD